jgi:hypothetical protein
LWLSDGPATPGKWAQLLAERNDSGLSPMLLAGLHRDESRPWAEGELWVGEMSSPADHDPATLLEQWWSDYTHVDDEHDHLSVEDRLAVTAPYGQRWPGLAAQGVQTSDADTAACVVADSLLKRRPHMRLGLVAAERSADVLAIAGWMGAANYTNDIGEICAVLRGWEDRFGARLVGAGFAELYLSVAAPPTDLDEALHVAAEHFAFCPDNVWQSHAHTLPRYAEALVGAESWSFWWD